ncbi:MAG: hypothetical protein ACLRZ6_10175 [Lachnospiraceae bacterium]
MILDLFRLNGKLLLLLAQTQIRTGLCVAFEAGATVIGLHEEAAPRLAKVEAVGGISL